MHKHVGNHYQSHSKGMKDTLEYKILRFLKDNDNGDFINVTNLIEDRKLLESKLQSLAKKPEKYISYIPPIFFFGFGLPNKENNELKAKIEVNGIILLDKIENQSLVFSINQETNKTNANKYKPWYKKLPINLWKLISENKLISTILVLLILYLLKTYFGIDLKKL